MQKNSGWRGALKWVFKLGLVAGIFAWLFYKKSITSGDLWELWERWPWALAAIVLSLPSVVISAVRYQILLKTLKIASRFGDIFSLTMIAMVFDLVSPVASGGDVVKALYLSRAENKSYGLLLFSVVLDRVIGIFALFMFALIVSVLAWPQIGSYENLRQMTVIVAVVCCAIVAGFFVLVSERLESSALRKRAMHLLPMHEKFERIYAGFAGLRHHKLTLSILVALSLLNHLVNCGVMLVIAQSLSFTTVVGNQPAAVPLIPCLTVLPIGMFLSTFGMAGGFGVGNLVFDELFKRILGLTGGAKLALFSQIAGLLFRILGVPFILFYRHKGIPLEAEAPVAAPQNGVPPELLAGDLDQ